MVFSSGARCVQVLDMYVQEEWVYWKDESSMNLDSQGGLYPRVSRSKFLGHLDTKIFYCYYTRCRVGRSVCAHSLLSALVNNQTVCYHGIIHLLTLLYGKFLYYKKMLYYRRHKLFQTCVNNFGSLVRSLFSWSLFGSFQFASHLELVFLF